MDVRNVDVVILERLDDPPAVGDHFFLVDIDPFVVELAQELDRREFVSGKVERGVVFAELLHHTASRIVVQFALLGGYRHGAFHTVFLFVQGFPFPGETFRRCVGTAVLDGVMLLFGGFFLVRIFLFRKEGRGKRFVGDFLRLLFFRFLRFVFLLLFFYRIGFSFLLSGRGGGLRLRQLGDLPVLRFFFLLQTGGFLPAGLLFGQALFPYLVEFLRGDAIVQDGPHDGQQCQQNGKSPADVALQQVVQTISPCSGVIGREIRQHHRQPKTPPDHLGTEQGDARERFVQGYYGGDGKTYGKDKKGGDAHAVHQGITDVVTGLAQQVGIAFAGLDTLVARAGKQIGSARQGDHHQHEGNDHGGNYTCGLRVLRARRPHA